jgi:ATP-dependent Lhr-like helicase
MNSNEGQRQLSVMTHGDSGDAATVLNGFHPAVSSWFRATFGEPTPAQRLGWPAIASGQNCLIVAPTGSGKTLAAFLTALDHLWTIPAAKPGVRILYISPLKALNQDVWRNLQVPLEEIQARSADMGDPLPVLRVAVRSGDTPSHERAAMVRKPPDILITTPESLHLILTSRARGMLRGISHVIVDEIHAVCPNKRGVFLALLLERLEAINPQSFVRIGLSATQRPLDEVARYLGGISRAGGASAGEGARFRPVTIVDAGWRRDLDLEVIWPRTLGRPIEAGTIWPEIEERLLALVREHRSTIIFANNRRTVEKLTSRLNALADPMSDSELIEDDAVAHDERGGEAPDEGGRSFRAHHGSISLPERKATEDALKAGQVPAVIATASLELGIDMGAVDLVCQVESPGSVARGLQRVGRAGHVVRGVSKGRMIAKTPGDLLESAALCRAMLQGGIEQLRVPRNCLDVLAQQVIACVAMDPWDVSALYELVRSAYPFQNLSAESFESVLRLVSGRFPSPELRDLRARVVWDRIHNRLTALPGTAQLALVGGGTIPDAGQFPVYLGDGGPRLGELDEEFVFERRVGETFTLGNASWRIETIDPHRVVASRAPGQTAVMPFWRGENAARSSELGEAIGLLSREISQRLDARDLQSWLQAECRLAPVAARALREYLARQKRLAGMVPDDRSILVETFIDPSGELSLAILTPLGGRVHHALKLALAGVIRQRLGLSPACLHSNQGLLFRLPMLDEPPLDLFEGLTAETAERLIREELPETSLFGLRFRQNAARALLLPRPDPAKRTPLWLQRLRAKDLLQIARQVPDFPIVLETVRECLEDDLELPRLRLLLDAIHRGEVTVHKRRGEIPSPFTSELILQFTAAHLYEWDEPERSDRQPSGSIFSDRSLDPLLRGDAPADWLDPQAIGRVENRLRHHGMPPRTVDEMAERLRLLGDMTESELSGPMAAFLAELKENGRAVSIVMAEVREPVRYILAEERDLYRAAFPGGFDDEALDFPVSSPEPPRPPLLEGGKEESRGTIVRRFLQTHALIGLADLTARYPIPAVEAGELLEHWCEEGKIVRIGEQGPAGESRWAESGNLTEMRRATVAARRRESLAVLPEVFADFLLRRQCVHPETVGEGATAVERVVEQLQGYVAAASMWENEILPRRVKGYRPAWLDEVLAQGNWFWRAEASGRDEPRVAFFRRDFPGVCAAAGQVDDLSANDARLLELLDGHGASFAVDLARLSGLGPSQVRVSLRTLMRRGLATNDRFDPVRAGSDNTLEVLSRAKTSRRAGLPLRPRAMKATVTKPEGRWWRLPPLAGDEEAGLARWADVLLARYGVLTREVVLLESFAPKWPQLAALLSRWEWRGELRRGYFVEGLSGLQYATERAASELSRLAAVTSGPSASAPGQPSIDPGGGAFRSSGALPVKPLVMVCTADPANIYGAGAPLDIELLEDGVARLPRGSGNYLVLREGRPVLIIECRGKRLTGLPWADRADLDRALGFLPNLQETGRRNLKVETYHGRPIAGSVIETRLLELGFVRDYPGMTFYGMWPAASPQASEASPDRAELSSSS